MFKRFGLVLIAVTMVSLAGCKKSEGTKIPNFFGAPPTVSEVSFTKQRKHFECQTVRNQCCFDPPACTCCCVADRIDSETVDIDLVTASVKVTDTTSASDILVVVLRFLDPPLGIGTPPRKQISLEMFDDGSAMQAGTVDVGGTIIKVNSGDVAPGDGTFVRKFYFGTKVPGGCIETTDNDTMNHTFSRYTTSVSADPSQAINFSFDVQAVDKSGNVATSPAVPLTIQGTFLEQMLGIKRPCGEPSGNGGCFPGP